MSEKVKFKPNPTLVGLVGLTAMAAQVVLSVRQSVQSSYVIGAAVGAMLATILIAYVFGFVAFVVAKRSNLVGSIAFGLLAAVMVGGKAMLALRTSVPPSPKAVAAISDAARESRESIKSGDPNRSVEASKKLADAVSNAAGEASGIEKAAMLATSAFSERLSAAVRQRQEAGAALGAANGFGWSDVKSKEDLDAKIGLFDAAIAATEELMRVVDQADELLRTDMKARGYERMEESNWMRSFQAGMGPSKRLTLQKHQAGLKIFQEGRGLVVLLRDSYGRWKPEGEKVILEGDSDDLIERFNAGLASIRAESKREAELMQELQELLQRQSGQAPAGNRGPKNGGSGGGG